MLNILKNAENAEISEKSEKIENTNINCNMLCNANVNLKHLS